MKKIEERLKLRDTRGNTTEQEFERLQEDEDNGR